MKTISLLFSFVTLFLSIKSYSQEKKLFLGFRGGVNYTTTSSPGIYNHPAYKTGICAGLNFGYKIHKNILLALDIDYDQKGYKEPSLLTDNAGNPIGDDNSKLKLNYVTLPISVNYSTIGKNTFEAGIGIYNSFLISAHEDFDGISASGEPWETIDVKKFLKTYEPGIFVRTGYAIHLSSAVGLFVEAKYNHGFSNASKNEQWKLINSGFFFGTGLRFYFLTKTE